MQQRTATLQKLQNGDTMTDFESDNLAGLPNAGECPTCGSVISEGTAVVRGARSFCSLDCVATFYEVEFSKRARQLSKSPLN